MEKDIPGRATASLKPWKACPRQRTVWFIVAGTEGGRLEGFCVPLLQPKNKTQDQLRSPVPVVFKEHSCPAPPYMWRLSKLQSWRGEPTPPLSWRCSRLRGASWGKFLGEQTWFLGQETSGRSQEGEGRTAKPVGLVHRPLPGFVRHWLSAQSWPNLCSCKDSVQGCHPMSPLWDLDHPFFLAQAHPTLSMHWDESSACSLPHST